MSSKFTSPTTTTETTPSAFQASPSSRAPCDNYYLLRLEHPFVVEQNDVTQLLVQPRYNGDNINLAVSGTCTVTIARVHGNVDLTQNEKISFDDFERWGVGKISPPI